MHLKTINNIPKTGLLISASQKVKLTKGQNALLISIRACVSEQKSLDWNTIVDCYIVGIRKEYPRKEWKRGKEIISIDGISHFDRSGYVYTGEQFIIKDEFINDTHTWRYTLRALVRNWFLSSIGILVMKNQLIVIPTIEIE